MTDFSFCHAAFFSRRFFHLFSNYETRKKASRSNRKGNYYLPPRKYHEMQKFQQFVKAKT